MTARARITTESLTRIDHIDEYVEQFKMAMIDGNYASARDALDKAQTIVSQCKQDVEVLRRSTDESGNEFPRYAKLGASELRHQGDGVYYRDAGCWDVQTGWRDGKLVAVEEDGPMAHAYGLELAEITEEEWRDGNKGYLGRLPRPIDRHEHEYDDDYCEADDDIPF
jgi:hypothetical protein